MIAPMARIASRILPLALALAFAAGGCAVLDTEPSRVTIAELFAGS